MNRLSEDLKKAASKIIELCMNPDAKAEDILDKAELLLFELRIREGLDDICKVFKDSEGKSEILTKDKYIDNELNLKKGNLYLISGSKKEKLQEFRIKLLNVMTDSSEINSRYYSLSSSENNFSYPEGKPSWIIDRSNITSLMELHAKARLLKARDNELSVVVVDNIEHLISPQDRGSISPTEYEDHTFYRLRAMARDLDIALIAIMNSESKREIKNRFINRVINL